MSIPLERATRSSTSTSGQGRWRLRSPALAWRYQSRGSSRTASGNLSNHYGYQCRYGDFILNASLEATARSLSETSSIRDVGNVLFYPSNLSHLMPSHAISIVSNVGVRALSPCARALSLLQEISFEGVLCLFHRQLFSSARLCIQAICCW